MKATYLIPIAAAGAVVLYFMSKAQAGKNIKVYLNNLKFSGGKILPNAFLEFRVLNGSSTAVTIDSLIGEVFVNGKFFASVSNTDRFTVPANAETFYTVKLTPAGLNLIGIVFSLLKSRQSIIVEFNGTINSTGALIPVQQKINVLG